MNQPERPRVAVLSLGGTVAMTSRDGHGAAPTEGAAQLVATVPGLQDLAEVSAVSLSATPGGSLRIAELIGHLPRLEAACQDGADGVVLTTGTDTLEEVAYLYHLLWRRREPLVVTGAMRTADTPGSDGPANLKAAVTVAASPTARGHGCLVVLNDEVHAAAAARKAHTTRLDAFRSVGRAKVGELHEGAAVLVPPPSRPTPIEVPDRVARVPRVALIRATMDDDAALLRHAAQSYDAVVVETFGAGHLPSWWVEPLSAAASRLPVAVVSRTGDGRLLRSSYGFPGSERDLVAADTLFLDGLDGVKARILLTLALLSSPDRGEITRIVLANCPLSTVTTTEGAR